MDWFDRFQIFDNSRDLAQSILFHPFLNLFTTIFLDFLPIFIFLDIKQDRFIFANKKDLKLANFDGTFNKLFLFLA